MKKNDSALYEKLEQLQWLMRHYRTQNHMEHGPFGDTTRGQGRVLAILKMAPEISTKDLSYMMGIRHQSLNELLNKLEKAGYITRSRAEEDRRITMVRLTEKGIAEQQEEKDVYDIFSCLSLEEQASFSDNLDRMIAALKTQLQIDESWDEDMEDWVRAARSRMGDEMFERLMNARGSFPHRGHGHHDHKHGHDHDRHFCDGFRPGRRGGSMPEGRNGSEWFSSGCKGPMAFKEIWGTSDESSEEGEIPPSNGPRPN